MKKKKLVITSLTILLVGLLVIGIVILINNNSKRMRVEDFEELTEIVPIKEKTNINDNNKFSIEVVERMDYSYITPDKYDVMEAEEVAEAEMYGMEMVLENIDYSDEEYEKVSRQGLVDWAFRAYNEGWEYRYGGCEEGFVDCSGLIKSFVGVCSRGTEGLLAESTKKGDISTIPEIPGLGVYMYGHVGIYVGNGMVIDARNENDWIRYDEIEYMKWEKWFEIKGVEYEYELQ